MTIPNMGYMIGSQYDVVLIHLCMSSSLIFFPLRSLTPSVAQQLIVIEFVDGNHFEQIYITYLRDHLVL